MKPVAIPAPKDPVERTEFFKSLEKDHDDRIRRADEELADARQKLKAAEARAIYMRRRKSTYYLTRTLSAFIRIKEHLSMQHVREFLLRMECKTTKDRS